MVVTKLLMLPHKTVKVSYIIVSYTNFDKDREHFHIGNIFNIIRDQYCKQSCHLQMYRMNILL